VQRFCGGLDQHLSETSSPALSLAPGEEHVHVHRTIHLVGPDADLDAVARTVLKVPLAEIAGAFKASSRRTRFPPDPC
jgi:hypothetical protein